MSATRRFRLSKELLQLLTPEDADASFWTMQSNKNHHRNVLHSMIIGKKYLSSLTHDVRTLLEFIADRDIIRTLMGQVDNYQQTPITKAMQQIPDRALSSKVVNILRFYSE